MLNVSQQLKHLEPGQLSSLTDRLGLIGLVLAQLALLDIVADDGASTTARVQAAKELTSLVKDPQTVSERLKSSQFEDMTPDELKKLVRDLQSGKVELAELLQEGTEEEES